MPIFDRMKSLFSLPSAEKKNRDKENLLITKKKAVYNDKPIASNFIEENYQSKQQDINYFSKGISQEKKATNTINSLTYKSHEIISMSSPFAYQQRTLISAENFLKEKDYNTAKQIYTKLLNKIPIKSIRDKLQMNLQDIEHIQKKKAQATPHLSDKKVDHKNDTINQSQDDYNNVEIKTLAPNNFKPNQFKDQKDLPLSLAKEMLQHINQSVTEIKKMTHKIKAIEDILPQKKSKGDQEENKSIINHPNKPQINHRKQEDNKIDKKTSKDQSDHPNIDPNQFKDQKKLRPSLIEEILQHINQSVMEIKKATSKTKKIKKVQKKLSPKKITQPQDKLNKIPPIKESTLNASTLPQKNNVNNKIQKDSEGTSSNKEFKENQEINEATIIDKDIGKVNQSLENKPNKIPPTKESTSNASTSPQENNVNNKIQKDSEGTFSNKEFKENQEINEATIIDRDIEKVNQSLENKPNKISPTKESTLNASTSPQENNINNKIQKDSERTFSNKEFKENQEINEATIIDRDIEKVNQSLKDKPNKIPPIKESTLNASTSPQKNNVNSKIQKDSEGTSSNKEFKENIIQRHSAFQTTKKSSQESKSEEELFNEKKPLPQEVHGIFNIEPPGLEDSPYLMLTYDFTKIPYHFRISKDNQFFEYTYYKYKPMLSKAHKFIKNKQIGKALSYYKVVNDQEIPDELRDMINKNVQDINDFMQKYLS